VACLLAWPAWALSPDAKEFMTIARELEPVLCEQRKLRREMALAEVQGQSTKAQRERFARIESDPHTAKLQRRLAQLEPRVSKSSDPEDLPAISRQHTEAYYRCE
jgi:hypothetical protein